MMLDELAALIQAPPEAPLGEPLNEAKASLGAPKSYARLVLAGGRGSRLGLGPKALVEVNGKRLISYFLEDDVPTYVMSAADCEEAIAKVAPGAHLFSQAELPLLDKDAKPFGSAPCGNGDALAALKRFLLLDQIKAERLIVLPVDNPLGIRAEKLLCQGEGDVLIAAVRANPSERAGGLIEVDGKVRVVEYLHNEWPFPLVNTGIYSLSMDFVRRVCELPLPIHPVEKEGAWKFEKFLFDTFAYAENSKALEFARSDIFSPIKTQADIEKFTDSPYAKQ